VIKQEGRGIISPADLILVNQMSNIYKIRKISY
jgi:hypothetical protein